MAILIGKQLGQYEITGKLGSGGMGEVYRALQKSMKRDVAIKVIDLGILDRDQQAEAERRFETEARAIATLNHPYILKVFDYARQDEYLYLVTDLMAGSLDKLMERQLLSVALASRIFEQIGMAADYAHRRGMIHRDIKPRNILLDEEQNAFLMDFGLVKIKGSLAHLTRTGVLLGTPDYMAPEQWEGKGIDARTDIYALGITLFEMLSGRVPFVANTPYHAMSLHVTEAVPSLHQRRPDLPSDVDAVIQKALAKKPEDRFQSVPDFVRAYQSLMQEKLRTGTFLMITPSDMPQAQSAPARAAVEAPSQGAVTRKTMAPQQIGQYVILSVAGKSQASTIYQAQSTSTKARVNLKVIETGPMSEKFIQNFRQDSADIMALRHPHILRLMELGITTNAIYMASHFASTMTLGDVLESEQLSIQQICLLMNQIASALDYAHQQAIYHGDLRPQSVHVDANGEALLTDLGIADILDDYNRQLHDSGMFAAIPEGQRTAVATRDAEGVPGYLHAGRLAPERWQNQRANERTDVYQLGILLFEMLVRRLPFTSTSTTQMRKMHLSDLPPSVRSIRPELPSSIDAIVQMALAKDPKQRFATAGQLARAFNKQFSSFLMR